MFSCFLVLSFRRNILLMSSRRGVACLPLEGHQKEIGTQSQGSATMFSHRHAVFFVLMRRSSHNTRCAAWAWAWACKKRKSSRVPGKRHIPQRRVPTQARRYRYHRQRRHGIAHMHRHQVSRKKSKTFFNPSHLPLPSFSRHSLSGQVLYLTQTPTPRPRSPPSPPTSPDSSASSSHPPPQPPSPSPRPPPTPNPYSSPQTPLPAATSPSPTY